MSVVIEKIGFASREEAIKLAKSEGFFFRDGAMETGDIEDIHWHKTDYISTSSLGYSRHSTRRETRS